MADPEAVRTKRKRAVTRTKNIVKQLIAEEEIEQVKKEIINLKDVFYEFQEAHDTFHDKLEGDEDIDKSELYFIEKTTEVAGNIKVDILIGQDNPKARIPLKVHRGEEGDPFAVRTLFGWSVNGPVGDKANKQVITHFITTTPDTQYDIKKLWELENEDICGDDKGMSVTKHCWQNCQKWTRQRESTFSVRTITSKHSVSTGIQLLTPFTLT